MLSKQKERIAWALRACFLPCEGENPSTAAATPSLGEKIAACLSLSHVCDLHIVYHIFYHVPNALAVARNASNNRTPFIMIIIVGGERRLFCVHKLRHIRQVGPVHVLQSSWPVNWRTQAIRKQREVLVVRRHQEQSYSQHQHHNTTGCVAAVVAADCSYFHQYKSNETFPSSRSLCGRSNCFW